MIRCKECGEEIKEKIKKCPKCGADLKKRSIAAFFVKMTVIFLLIFEVVISIILMTGAQIGISNYKYGMDFVWETILALLILVVMLLFGNAYVFREKKVKFVDAVFMGWPILAMAVITFMVNLSYIRETGFNLLTLTNLIAYCCTIGIAEELLCRGWLLNEFTERFNKNKKQIILSIVLSSLVFGIMHITNLWNSNQGLFETLTQIIQATACGFFFGAIYYKTKNIWSVIFLHAFYDFSIMLGEINQIRDCEPGVLSNQVIAYTVIMSVIIVVAYVLGGILVLRGKGEDEFFKETEKTKKQNKIFIIIIIIGLILTFIPFHIKGEDEAEVCFTYEKIGTKNGYESNFIYQRKSHFELNNGDTTITISAVGYDEVILENQNGKKIGLDYEVEELYVFENTDYYGIIINSPDIVNSSIYYAKIFKSTIDNNDSTLENIKNSFVKYDLPSIVNIGSMRYLGTDEYLPYMESDIADSYMIDADGKLYLIED